jgi:hypothetical protein
VVTVVTTPVDIQRRAEQTAQAEAAAAKAVPQSAGIAVTGAGAFGRGDLDSKGPKATVTVTDSADINALAEALVFTSLGENLAIKNSNFSNPGSAIILDLETAFQRTLTLTNTTLSADVVKARGFSAPNRDGLVIDGSRFNASTLLRLYSEGGSTLRFRGNVELNSPLSELAARQIIIEAGGKVNAAGDLRVFTDKAEFDKAGRGSLTVPEGRLKEIRSHGERSGF